MEDVAPLTGSSSSTRSPWSFLPYVIAVCFMISTLVLACKVASLRRQVNAAQATLSAWQWQISDQAQHQVLAELRLSLLEARDPAYGLAKIVVSWNPHLHEGMVTTESLPVPPTGSHYQLWVLDPHEATPVNGGVINLDPAPQHFIVHALQTDLPGFAVSLESTGDSLSPTGPILLAIAPPP